LLAEVRRAETRSEAIQAFFVQKRFELRSVIATKNTGNNLITSSIFYFIYNNKNK